MDTGSLEHAVTDQGRASGLTPTLPQGDSSRSWTKREWSAYLEKLRVEVDAGEVPVKLYLHGLEILGAQQDTKWVCLQKEPGANQAQASTDTTAKQQEDRSRAQFH